MDNVIRIKHLKRQKFTFETKFLDKLNHYTRNHPLAKKDYAFIWACYTLLHIM